SLNPARGCRSEMGAPTGRQYPEGLTRAKGAPEGQRNVATGGAQRNPWARFFHSRAPEGQRNVATGERSGTRGEGPPVVVPRRGTGASSPVRATAEPRSRSCPAIRTHPENANRRWALSEDDRIQQGLTRPIGAP